jgi:hypothetical protein
MTPKGCPCHTCGTVIEGYFGFFCPPSWKVIEEVHANKKKVSDEQPSNK